ncbi:hypothetical protein [Flavobacterium sp. FlaQc-48]|uniref:hypothetical protein n=1 Tax=Flavobacterium sp. FlaQc-48 TaxID=3374181 RepID=UPI00375736BF
MKILLLLDKDLPINFELLTKFLNQKTDFVKFEFNSNLISFPNELMTKSKTFEDVENQIKVVSKEYDKLFCFTDKQYIDNFFMHDENNLAIFSFYDWDYLTDLPMSNGTLHFIIYYLALYINRPEFRHYENTGCMYDFLYDKSGIDSGMRQAGFCSNCLERISESLMSEDDFKIFKDLKVLMNVLSEYSRWNKNILSDIKKSTSKIQKRKAKKSDAIRVVIASPGDTASERKILLDSLEVKFRRDLHEKHCGFRIIVNGWEDLASQNGYPQDVINEKIITESDFVVTIFKHKLGTPTIDINTNSERFESGTVEELFQALDTSKSNHPIGMAYFFSTAPVISLDSPEKLKIETEWNRLTKFKESIKNKMIFKPYIEGNELINLILKDLEKNIIDFIIK